MIGTTRYHLYYSHDISYLQLRNSKNIGTVGISLNDYYKSAPMDSQAQLKALHTFLVPLVPNPNERLSYGIPHLFVDGKRIIGFGGFAHHVSIFPGGGELIEKYTDALTPHKTEGYHSVSTR